MKAADYIAKKLYDAGVRHIFGIPGGSSLTWIESFRKSGIEFILTSHEGAAGIMACVTSRLTGKPGVCHSTYGPGATNLSTGAGCALLDRDRIIILSSEMKDEMAGRTAQMNINHEQLFSPLVKATFRLSPDNVAEVVDKALNISSLEYPGPVHIGLTDGLADAEVIYTQKSQTEFKHESIKNDEEGIKKLLKNSRKPLIAAGLTLARTGFSPALLSFLSEFDIPVVLTPMAKEVLPRQHPSYAGVLFHAGSSCLKKLIENCDLVIGLGYDPVEYNYESWVPEVPLLHFDTRITDMPRNRNVLQFTGTSSEWFRILRNMEASNLESRTGIINEVREQLNALFESCEGNFGPAEAVSILRSELPDDAILTADVGSHLHLLGQIWDTREKGSFLITNGWSGMGFGLPAANAAAICRPDAKIACITGDGGFLMSAGEIMTARRYDLPVMIIVFSDRELNLIRLKEEWRNMAHSVTSLYRDDLFGADSFLGVKVFHARNREEFATAVREAMSCRKPSIINAMIDPCDYRKIIVKQ